MRDKKQHAEYTREWRKRIKKDPERFAEYLKGKRDRERLYRARRGAKKGGRKPLAFAEAMQTVRCSQGLHCSDCSKWHPSYCAITCAARFANSPMCRYGARLHNNEECMRRYHERKETAE